MYNYEKMSSELIMSLSIDSNERNDSPELVVGFNSSLLLWELVIRYIGDIERLSNQIGFSYIKLYGNFAIINILQEKIESLTYSSEVIYIDKPKSMYFENAIFKLNNQGSICAYDLNDSDVILTGKDVIVAVLDTGINYLNEVFIRNGKTRIIELWDQNTEEVYDEYMLNQDVEDYLDNGYIAYTASNDINGHGTAVAGIIAEQAENVKFLIVKLATIDNNGMPRTSSIMSAIDYVVNKAITLDMPLVINLSYGNNYGAHDGSSILERYIDNIALASRNIIVTGTGNEGLARKHVEIRLNNNSWKEAQLLIGDYIASINIQIWYDTVDNMDVILVMPDYEEIGPINKFGTVNFYNTTNKICVINSSSTPYNKAGEIFINISAGNNYIQSGVWYIKIRPKMIINGRIDMWLPSSAGSSGDVYFLNSNANTSLTIPSTAFYPIAVGAFNDKAFSYTGFSGRGYTRDSRVKPDISAPGVDISVPAGLNGRNVVSGTSFAVPFVSAGAALLMEWGIVNKNDIYLYGERLKVALVNGARRNIPMPNEDDYPNEIYGYGTLCISKSLDYLKNNRIL